MSLALLERPLPDTQTKLFVPPSETSLNVMVQTFDISSQRLSEDACGRRTFAQWIRLTSLWSYFIALNSCAKTEGWIEWTPTKSMQMMGAVRHRLKPSYGQVLPLVRTVRWGLSLRLLLDTLRQRSTSALKSLIAWIMLSKMGWTSPTLASWLKRSSKSFSWAEWRQDPFLKAEVMAATQGLAGKNWISETLANPIVKIDVDDADGLTAEERELVYGEDRESAWAQWDTATGEHRWKLYLEDADRWKDGSSSQDPEATEELDLRELQMLLAKHKAVPNTIVGGFI